MERSDIEGIMRSVIRDYGLGVSVGQMARCEGNWSIEVAEGSRGARTLVVVDSSAHSIRRALMTALGADADS